MRKIWWEKWPNITNDNQIYEQNSQLEVFIKTQNGFIPSKTLDPILDGIHFWLVHTNFDIEKNEILIINNTPGIAMFTPMGPYMFRISVGKLFNINKVFKKLATNLGCVLKKDILLSNEQIKQIKKSKIDLTNNKYWLMYIFPNGNFEPYSFDDEFDFLSCHSYFKNLKSSIGGQVLSTLTDKIGV